ncbi:MAG TPA: putative DNA modification/repair radical SAM protein [Spirochaetia bacterium]|nr:putative DNA modification/repair radical SAM protein [Spirochaetia bacterium]
MDMYEKLTILADAAKYDVSCASSGSSRPSQAGGPGNTVAAGICHSWADDGRCISLLKILLSNVCVYDCAYCANRKSNDGPRATFTVQEVVDLTLNFYRRNYIEGLFLSSAVIGDPEATMERIFRIVRTLRETHRFNGYIHVKAIPGARLETIRKTGFYVDRMSVNIELPSESSLALLAPDKRKEDIFRPMAMIGHEWRGLLEDRVSSRRPEASPRFVPAGQSTQLIVGASPDTDRDIIRVSSRLYQSFCMKRVHYSAYVPVNSDTRLPALSTPPLKREHRLYQADWLMRFYRFDAEEIFDSGMPYLDQEIDPKAAWALRHFELFPVEVNRAEYTTLLRVPGIGVKSAQRIISARRVSPLTFETLKTIGVVLKRAQYFITCGGKAPGRFKDDPCYVRGCLVGVEGEVGDFTGGESSNRLPPAGTPPRTLIGGAFAPPQPTGKLPICGQPTGGQLTLFP